MPKSNHMASPKPSEPSDPYPSTNKSLIQVHFKCWPTPDASQNKRLHRLLVKQLGHLLNPKFLKHPSSGYKAKSTSTSPRARAAAAADDKDCWVDSSTIEACDTGVCRIDHYVCSDGTTYDRKVPIDGSLEMTRQKSALRAAHQA